MTSGTVPLHPNRGNEFEFVKGRCLLGKVETLKFRYIIVPLVFFTEYPIYQHLPAQKRHE
ncbi:hypothetical protein JMJ77_0010066 [Colletotrichum scovillei]|uniref:Uncharacterized protein n=1 Tax=Colletotrichum scovillei TaxID=1209932 RepID=A0A9P7UAZ7_9PEZI|nr:hypothetical protein JMJ78_0001142 [Colletotrichum scovillei]KAG7040962.1 hypothetical protein JMJ77_0010066 [Colletotrichum scovillei]KAG7060995.1 hypothetical protein JMJ76_0010067 [Colletotrichum scovillei]